jgi:nucleotide-binding universal stress UspA family protein
MKLLHPTDFSETAEQAEAQALALARALGAEIVLLHVAVETPLYSEGGLGVETQQIYEAQREWAEQTLEARTAALRARGVQARWVRRVGVPFEEIVEAAAAERADLIVMGTHGRSGLNRLLLGSVVDRVIRLAPCPVLAVREPGSAKAA